MAVPGASAKPKVLLVEDDPFMVSLLYEALTKDGFEVVSARDGEEGIRKFSQVKPDILLVDILLPKKNGLEALREIRSLSGGADVPAVVLTNLEDGEYLKDAQSLGVKDYLVKANMELPEITAKVREVLARK